MGLKDRLSALLGRSAYSPAPSELPSLDAPSVKKTRRALGGQLTPLPTTKLRWYFEELETAQRAADTGDLSLAAQLMRAFRSDGVVAGVGATRTEGLVRLPKRFRGDPEIVSALQLGGDSVRSVFDEMFPPSETAALASDGVFLGVGVGEMVPVEGRDFPVLVRLDPEFLVYRWSENRWYYRSVAGLLPITPGDGRWILHIPGGRTYPWQSGLWRAVGYSWITKTHAANYKANWESKLANPARVAVSPQGATEPQRLSWFQKVMAWGVNSVFGVPAGYDVRLLESNGVGHESWEKTIDRCDREVIIAVAGQTVTTDGGTGFSNADIHKSIRSDLIQATADSLAYTINTQGIPAFVIARWGEEALDRSPCVSWDTTPSKDLNSEATALLSVANAIKGLSEALTISGARLDVAAISARFGIPILGDVDGDGVADVEPKQLDTPVVETNGESIDASDEVAA